MMTPRRFVPALALLSLLLAADPARAQRYAVEEIAVDAAVQPDGAIDVRERLTYDFRGRFRFAFRDVPRTSGERIEQIEVREGGRAYERSESEEPGTFQVTEEDESVRVTWHYQARDERRTFDLAYRIAGPVKRYPDTAELYFKFVGDEWDRPIGRVRATVSFPEPLPRQALRAWAHGPLHGTVSIADEGTVVFDVSPLPRRTFWEGRVLFPPDVVAPLALASTGPRMDAILAEERAWAEQANARRLARERRSELAGQFVWIAVLLVPAGLFAWWLAYRRYGRPHDVYVPMSAGEVPSDHPPVLVQYLFSRQVGATAIVATLLDLARRGYLSIQETERTTSGVFGSRSKADYRFDLTGRSTADLQPFERDLLEFLLREGGDPAGFTMSSLTSMASKGRKPFRQWFSGWTREVKALGRAASFYEPYATGAMVRNVMVGMVMIVAGILLSAVSASPAGVPAIAGGVIVAILTIALGRRTAEGQRLFLAWRDFRTHLKSIGRALGPVSVDSDTWGRYLPFAVIFGLHRKLLPRLQPTGADGHPVTPVWFATLHGHGHGFDGSMSALSTSVSSMVTSVSSSMASATGTGGGASAGGGGGSGGGGGGAG